MEIRDEGITRVSFGPGAAAFKFDLESEKLAHAAEVTAANAAAAAAHGNPVVAQVWPASMSLPTGSLIG